MATMSQLTFVPFAETHIAGAARLLAERHAAHRLLEPLLPQVSDFGRQVANEFEDATGTAAIVGGDVAGYLIGKRREDEIGPHVWSGLAGHAAGDPKPGANTPDRYQTETLSCKTRSCCVTCGAEVRP